MSKLSRRNLQLLCFCVLLVALAFQFWKADFLTRPYVITHETISYTDEAGIRAGISLSNFASDARAPGYSLFLALATLGELPNPSAMTYAHCGDTSLEQIKAVKRPRQMAATRSCCGRTRSYIITADIRRSCSGDPY
jgi:hypothetical protein